VRRHVEARLKQPGLRTVGGVEILLHVAAHAVAPRAFADADPGQQNKQMAQDIGAAAVVGQACCGEKRVVEDQDVLVVAGRLGFRHLRCRGVAGL
jgi:hypothetical protein